MSKNGPIFKFSIFQKNAKIGQNGLFCQFFYPKIFLKFWKIFSTSRAPFGPFLLKTFRNLSKPFVHLWVTFEQKWTNFEIFDFSKKCQNWPKWAILAFFYPKIFLNFWKFFSTSRAPFGPFLLKTFQNLSKPLVHLWVAFEQKWTNFEIFDFSKKCQIWQIWPILAIFWPQKFFQKVENPTPRWLFLGLRDRLFTP